MREKLIELIRKGKKAFTKSDETYIEKYLADCLLENGVVVLPCKIESELYFPSSGNNRVFTTKVYRILIDETGNYACAGIVRFPFENIGKTVFLTKEEAEKALERSKQ